VRLRRPFAQRPPVQFARMKMLGKVGAIHWILSLWILLGASAWVAAEPVDSLHANNYVNDFAGVLDAATQARLNDLCQQVDQKAHAQIAVVTVKSLGGQDPATYAVALYQKWGIGSKGKDRGVLILLATDDHKYWTTVGYGLESILPDGKVGGFGREAVPLLKSGNYAGAVTLMTARVASVIAQDAGVTFENQPQLAAPRQRSAPSGGFPPMASSSSSSLSFFPFSGRSLGAADPGAAADSGPDCYGACCLATWAEVAADTAAADLVVGSVAAVVGADLVVLAVAARAAVERAAVGRE